MKLAKMYTFYDDYWYDEHYEEIREDLFNGQMEDYWQTIADVPDEAVDEGISFRRSSDWYEFKKDLDRLMTEDVFLVTGTCGRWDGPCACGQFVYNADDLMKGLSHLDYLNFYEVEGRFYIDGSHHDGYDHYELRVLTEAGLKYARDNWFEHDRELHEVIIQCEAYSQPPNFVRKITGVCDEN